MPRGKRGEVWQFLAEQYCTKVAPIDTAKYPNYNVTYETLLKQLTSHQHAILIDLGRTFPNHSYFSSPLGPGQLALFNLLKAYSLLDPEVGYCQGLSFVAGVLLLHVSRSVILLKFTALLLIYLENYISTIKIQNKIYSDLYILKIVRRFGAQCLHQVSDNFKQPPPVSRCKITFFFIWCRYLLISSLKRTIWAT